MELWQKWGHVIMTKNENMKLWNIWECKNCEWYENVKIMNDMRMWYYEWYENVILWVIWECDIMNDMRKSNYE